MNPARLIISDNSFREFNRFPIGNDSLQINEIKSKQISQLNFFYGNAVNLDEQLFDSKANCKIEISKVSMYITREWRLGIYRQLDSLMDIENWEDDDKPVIRESFVTLLRLLTLLKPIRRPGLGSTSHGNIMAMWTGESERVTIECQPHDRLRCVASRLNSDGIRESSASDIQTSSILEFLSPFNTDRLFKNNDTLSHTKRTPHYSPRSLEQTNKG